MTARPAAPRRRHRIPAVLAVAAALLLGGTTPGEADRPVLAEDGIVLLIRHTNAPGTYPDPQGFRADDCATQRNLDDRGRAEARALGEALRTAGARVGAVFASPWCRARETAELMDLGPVTVTEALSNLSGRHGTPERVAAAERLFVPLVREWAGPGVLVMVGHGATIHHFTGIRPSQGGAVAVRPKPGAVPPFEVIGPVELE